jgi:Domain of unknown function (DUF4166)
VALMAGESLFAILLGAAFADMPAAIQRVHDGRNKLLIGRCAVQRGTGFWSRVFARAASLPSAGDDQEVSVNITCSAEGECWLRKFSGKQMRSRLTTEQNLLVERLGPMRFVFSLVYDDSTRELHWLLREVKTLGIPLPLAWFSAVSARESYEDGRYQFDVRASLPLVGLLVHYRGWLSIT